MKISDGGIESGTEGARDIAELVRSAAPEMTPLQRMKGFQAVSARLQRRRSTVGRRRAGLLALSLVGGGAVAAIALIALRVERPTATAPAPAPGPAPIAYQIQGGEMGAGGY